MENQTIASMELGQSNAVVQRIKLRARHPREENGSLQDARSNSCLVQPGSQTIASMQIGQ